MKGRNYGIDLLRLVLMFMVCILHTLGQGGILKACEESSLQFKVYWFIELLAYCAVDGFGLISGYTASDRLQKYNKLVEMWFQVLFYSFIVTVLFVMAGKYTIDIKGLIHSIFPVTYTKFWYFTAYFALFFTIPVLNKFLFSINDVLAKRYLIIFVFLYSVLGMIDDPFKTFNGYSTIWLMVLYCIGVLVNRTHLFEKRSSVFLIIIWGCCIIVTWGLKVFIGIGRLINYVSPTILLNGIIMIILFSRLHPNPKVIKVLSPLAFGIYLFQLNTVIWERIIKDAFVNVLSMNILIGIMLVFGYSSLIFLCGMIVEYVRSKLAELIRIPILSKKIVSLFELIISKLLILFE